MFRPLQLILACLIAALTTATQAADPGCCPHCQGQGQPVWEDVITHRCRMVPDVKPIKKTIYEVKEVPFCLHQLPPLCSQHGCCDCLECDCPRYKKVLLKKEIVCGEICSSKCVIEEVVERRLVCREVCPHCGCNPAPLPAPATSVPVPLPPIEPVTGP